jgi:hypothetical protein
MRAVGGRTADGNHGHTRHERAAESVALERLKVVAKLSQPDDENSLIQLNAGARAFMALPSNRPPAATL